MMSAALSIWLGRRLERGGFTRAAIALLCASATAAAEPVSVRFPEHEAHAGMVLRTLDGAELAKGQWTQTVEGFDVTTHVVFHFTDGSLHDESVTFSQDGRLRLLRDHLVQAGPAFPCDLDQSVDGRSGMVTVVCRDRNGGVKRYAEHLELPADLSNGMVPTVLKNVRDGSPRSVSLLVATPSPRVVQLVLAPPRRERLAGAGDAAVSHYVLKVEIGGIAGRLAPLVGKQPPDSHVWIADGDPPAYLRSDQPLFVGGPLWRIELVK
jgi:hypothetical protein